MSLDRPTRSIRLFQTGNDNDNVYLALFGRKFITRRLKFLFGLIQLIGSTRPKFDV